MNFKKYLGRAFFVLPFLVVIGSPVVSQADPQSHIMSVLRAHTYTLPQDLITFHYQALAYIEKKAPTDLNQAWRQITSAPNNFMNATQTEDLYGNGLYTAIDTASSRSFGGTNPLLYVVTLKKGARILDLRDDALWFSDVVNDFAALGCDFSLEESPTFSEVLSYRRLSLPAINGSTETRFRTRQPKECLAIAKSIILKSGAEAIQYIYAASQKISNCSGVRASAFNVIQNSAISQDIFGFYTDAVFFESTPMANLIQLLHQEAYRDAISAYSPQDPNQVRLPKTIPADITKADNFTTWKVSHIYGCGNEQFYPNSYIEKVTGVIPRTYAFRNKSVLERLTTAAYKKNIYSWNILNLKAVAIRNFTNFGIDPTFDVRLPISTLEKNKKFVAWQKAGIILNKRNDKAKLLTIREREALVSELLGEKTVIPVPSQSQEAPTSVLVKLIYRLGPSVYTSKIGMLASKMIEAGYSPRATQLLLDNLGINPPALSGGLRNNPKIDYSSAIKSDRETINSILKSCLRMYENPATTKEQINATKCGFYDDDAIF